jgi:hypothetical protein
MRYTKLFELIPNNTFGYDDKFKSFDDTFIEKLNYRYTVAVLLTFSYLVTSKQINGARKNIECFVPANLHLNNVGYTDYINEYCYLSLTYYIPHNEGLLTPSPKNEIKYYQLTHYFLILISIFIYLPRLFYSTLTLSLCDIDLKSLMNAILQLKFISSDTNKSAVLRYIVHYIDIYLSKSLRSRHMYGGAERQFWFNLKSNSKLLKIFSFMKIFYIVNLIISIKFLNYLLGNDFYTFFGIGYLKSLVYSNYQSNNLVESFFPKVCRLFFLKSFRNNFFLR